MNSSGSRPSVILAAGIGAGVSFALIPAIAMMAFLPALAASQANRRMAFASTFAYYVAASWPLTTAARYFWGPRDSVSLTLLLWVGSSALLATPWAAVWTANRKQLAWRMPLASIASVLPPLGFIGWAHPLTGAGLLFPGTAWVGTLLLVLGMPWLILRPRGALVVAVLLSAAANILHRDAPPAPSNWESVDTRFGDVDSHEFIAAVWIQERALRSSAQVIVFPEAVVPMWTEATELYWQKTLDGLRSRGKTILLGAGIPRPTMVQPNFDFTDTLQVLRGNLRSFATERPPPTDVPYFNAVLIRGAHTGQFQQRIPVPFGMWKPFTNSGVPLNAFGPAVLRVRDKRVAVLVCYEALLVWPFLHSMSERPSLIVVIANDHWDRNSAIPRFQRITAHLWSRLFNVPEMVAINQ